MENNYSFENIEKYLKIIAKSIIDEKIEKMDLDSNEKKVFEMTGVAKREDIIKETGLSGGTISNLWSKWEAKGIVYKDGKSYKKVIE
jgi:uncharacterized membrane protein